MGTTRNDTFRVDGDRATIAVDIPSGGLEIRQGPAGTIVVRIDAERAEDWEVDALGDRVTVRPQRRGWRTRNAKVLIEAPTATNLDLDSASADVRISGSFGDTKVRTASGDLDAESVLSLQVASASGDVEVRGVHGRLHVVTASGDVRVHRVDDDLDAGTTSGDVRIDRCDGSAINVKTVSGDITIGLPSGIRVEPEISTLSGSTRLPTAAPTSAGPRRTVRLRLRSVSGDITIRRVDR